MPIWVFETAIIVLLLAISLILVTIKDLLIEVRNLTEELLGENIAAGPDLE